MKTPNMVLSNRTNPTGAGHYPGKRKLDRYDAQTSFCWIDKLTAKIFKPKYRVEFQRCGLTAQRLAYQSVLKNSLEPKAIQQL